MTRSEHLTRVIGITGGIGSGKSEAIAYLERQYRATALRADEISRAQMLRGGECYEAVLGIFGEEVLTPDGELNRAMIAQKVFSNKDLLRRLNSVTHPAVHREVIERVEQARALGGRIICVEAALLLEENYDAICDEVWYICTDEKIRRDRLRRSRGYSDEKIDAIMKNQLAEEEFRKRCDVVIENNGDVIELRRKIDEQMAEQG